MLAILTSVLYVPQAQSGTLPPVLLSQATSTRAIALNSTTVAPEPFALTTLDSAGQPHRTRIMLFAMNLALPSGTDFSEVTANAEDSTRRRHPLTVEYVGPVSVGQQYVSQINLTLNNDMGDAGDVLVQIVYRGVASNRVRVGIGHVGGGLPDDSGAIPTPGPYLPRTYSISGRLTKSSGGLGGVAVALSGFMTASTVTDATGNYTFTNLAEGGNYTVTPAHFNYTFSPTNQSFNNLRANATRDFVATPVNFTISGRVTNENVNLSGVTVALSGSSSATTTTDANGNYGFTVPADGNYILTPSHLNFTFSPASFSINSLNGNRTVNFTIFKPTTYAISGRIAKSDGSGLPAIAVTLNGTGFTTSSTLTDGAGNYSFPTLTEGGNYTITAASVNYTFSPPTQSFNNLRANATGNFVATPVNFTISGRITNRNVGLSGVTVTLSGSQSATTTTDANGNYALNAAAGGNYVVTPPVQCCTFSPASQAFNNLSGNQTANFSTYDPFHVLEFDGSPQAVEFKEFWTDPTVNLPQFFWEFWARPGDNASPRYLLSDGYGGAHALLFGFNDGTSGTYSLAGNVWDGTTVISFGSDDGPAPNEWGHYAVGWDGAKLITYYNGVPVGMTPFTGPRRSLVGGGGGTLFIGGSDHQNMIGRISQVRGYEGINPRVDHSGSLAVSAAFRPQTLFSNGGNFLINFLRPAQTILDLSGGRVGILRGTGFGAGSSQQSYPAPQFIIDPTAPTASTTASPVVPGGSQNTPPPIPSRARVFDSFSRGNSTYAFDGNGGLGSTEGGSAGPQVWQYNRGPGEPLTFGILNGRAVMLGNESRGAWVSAGNGTANLDITVDRRPGFYGTGIATGLLFRFQDISNFFYAYTTGDTATTQKLMIGYYSGSGVVVLARDKTMPELWTTLRIITLESGSIQIFADSTLVYSTNISLLATAKNAGLWNFLYGQGLVNRWDNFAIYDAP